MDIYYIYNNNYILKYFILSLYSLFHFSPYYYCRWRKNRINEIYHSLSLSPLLLLMYRVILLILYLKVLENGRFILILKYLRVFYYVNINIHYLGTGIKSNI